MKKKNKKIVENHIEVQNICRTLESNYMPYAMSVIVSRALPEIDGFKPSHRKLLYTMYKMNLIKGERTKSANVVGQTMKLNPHGDMAIYETLVRLTRGNNALLHPFIDSKGNFGKVSARDMSYAAPRYTEVKLDEICNEIFRGIDEDMVEFVDNYDATMKEPKLLPTSFPNILVNPNKGIAVGMSCSFPSFNLKEICEFTIAKLKSNTGEINPMDYITGADFSTGGYIIKDDAALEKILNTGTGSFRIRAKYRWDKASNIIEIYEIPYTTTVEAIIDKIAQLIKSGKIKEISDLRDETDLSGLKLAIDLKRGQNAENLMNKLYKWTPLEDSFSCNFNVLIDLTPEVLGVSAIIEHWISFRMRCIRNSILFNLGKLKEELHLLSGLALVILDIDEAIRIIRNTQKESEVVKNLMRHFEIDEVQAEYIANMKLRNINREYLLKKIEQKQAIELEIKMKEEMYESDGLVKKHMVEELKQIIKKYAKPRCSEIIEIQEEAQVTDVVFEDYNIHLFMTKEGYFKKISGLSYRSASEHKLKEKDDIVLHSESVNSAEILFFTDKQNVYKMKAYEIPDVKASELGHYLNNLLEFEADEHVIFFHATTNFAGKFIFGYENGKISKVPVASYMTKTNRKKLIKAMSDKSRCVRILHIMEDEDILAIRRDSDKKNLLVFHSSLIPENTTKNSQGIQVIRLKKSSYMSNLFSKNEIELIDAEKYRVNNLPVAGVGIDVLDHFNYPNL